MSWDSPEAQAWLLSRPSAVQELFRRFPPGTTFEIEGRIAYMMGVGELEGGGHVLHLSWINPSEDYERATSELFNVCAGHTLEETNEPGV